MNTKENVISRLSTGLKRERTAYKAIGIVGLVTAIILIVIGMIFMIGGIFMTTSEAVVTEDFYYDYEVNGEDYTVDENAAIAIAGVGIMAFSGFYIGFGSALLAIAIVNLCLASRAGKHSKDPELTVKHAGSVGSIILAALFNEIALIFVIINFVTAKKNRNVL